MALQDAEVCDSLDYSGEYVAMSDMGKEILFLRQVWCFMLPKARMPCIAIDVRHHFLRELAERREIEIIHVASQYQHADFLTKALPEREFEFHRGESNEFDVISLSDSV